MGRTKVLIIIIVILLITNLVMLGFVLRTGKLQEKSNKIGFTEKLKNKVGFTPQQMEVFEPKKKAFWKNIRERLDKIKKTKEDFYYGMYDPSIPDSVIDAKAEVIGRQQKEFDLQVIRHFKDVRKLCTPEQLPKYDSLLPLIIRRMTDRPERK